MTLRVRHGVLGQFALALLSLSPWTGTVVAGKQSPKLDYNYWEVDGTAAAPAWLPMSETGIDRHLELDPRDSHGSV